tara:strand:- start:781 stop:1014 length:234 start_codon:yes stop_codon:yes gene_type:complete
MKPDRDTSGTYDWNKEINIKNEHTLSYQDIIVLISLLRSEECIVNKSTEKKLLSIKQTLDDDTVKAVSVTVEDERES